MMSRKKIVLIIIITIIIVLFSIQRCSVKSSISVYDSQYASTTVSDPEPETIESESIEAEIKELAREIGELWGEIKKEFLSGVEEGEK